MRISDWSSDVCSSDLELDGAAVAARIIVERAHRDGEVLTGRTLAGRDDEQPGAGHAVGCQRHDQALPRGFARPAVDPQPRAGQAVDGEIGRESCRGRVGPSVYISEGAVALQKNK